MSAVLSSDPQVLLVDNTTPSTPILRPQTNVPNGMVKLDAAGYVPANVLNITDMTFLGAWDASPGLLPTGTFATGDYYEIDVAGTLTLNTSGGSVAQPCNVGDSIIYNDATPGWWYSPAPSASYLPASAISFTPSGTIGATNVQAAIAELDSETQTALAVGLNTPMVKAHLDSFTNTVAGSTQIINPTVDFASGINNASGIFTPTVPGWYLCSINALCIGTTDALGLAIVATNDNFIQIQPPYATNNAYASAGGLTYCNGTTNTIKFGVFGSVAGCSFTNIKTSAVLVRKA